MKVKVVGQRAGSQCKKTLFSMTFHSGFDIWICDKMSWGMVHLEAIASHLPDTPMIVYGTGRWAHFNVKLHF